MPTSIEPVFFTTKEVKGYTETLAKTIREKLGKEQAELLLNHPIIYVHVWRSQCDVLNNRWSIYIGETNDLVQRTKEHWNVAKDSSKKGLNGKWQLNMIEGLATDEEGSPIVPTVYFFGHKLFHKSLTLDIENKLIDYCIAMETAETQNGRTNPQGSYAGEEYFDSIFSKIWNKLHKENQDLFEPEYHIKKSAIYKASPNHKLTESQKEVKQLIFDKTMKAMSSSKKDHQLILVEGDAGTGKTVLTSTTFYEMLDNELMDINCTMLINHEEQRDLYKNIARKLGHEEDIIQPPTTFLKERSILGSQDDYIPNPQNIADVVFVDEAHLLWNQNNQEFDTKFKRPQLDEIIDRSKVTVIMFDPYQVLHKGQIFTPEYMESKRELSKKQGNYISLKSQLRMNCAQSTMDWIDGLTKDLKINTLQLGKNGSDENKYEIKLFDSPTDLHNEIKKKSKKEESQLSRLIATQDWKYVNKRYRDDGKKYWGVEIEGYDLIPWNEQTFHIDIKPRLTKQERNRYKSLDWAEKDYSINEVGTTFTIQGFDLAYAGVILGPSVRYDKETGKIWFDKKYRALNYMKGNRIMQDGRIINVTSMISQNELRVLLTRGSKGLYIYACDADLREALKSAIICQK